MSNSFNEASSPSNLRPSWRGRDLITARGVAREEIEEILEEARKIEGDSTQFKRVLEGRILATLFFEPSTRTQFSFQTAMYKLGGQVISLSGAAGSSVAKGESLHDTIKLVEACADAIVIRHPREGSGQLAAEASRVPVINGGDGANQHPTQALLDLYTVKKELGKIDGLSFLFVGDLKYGRTVHSLAQMLSNYDVELLFHSPPGLKMASSMLGEVRNSVKVRELDAMELGSADVVYATRIQKERFADPEEYRKYSYQINAESLREMRSGALLMHPLPRVGEIHPEVDKDVRAAYFRQEANGVPVRMALLKKILGE